MEPRAQRRLQHRHRRGRVHRCTHVEHLRADIVNYVSPYNAIFQYPNLAGWASLDHLPSLARLNDEITRQALMIGYIDVFYLTTWTSFLGLPLILLLARPK